MEIAIGKNINLNQELKAFGIGTMTTVFFGGMIGCHSLSGAIIADNLKAQKRLTSLTTACVLLLFLSLGANFMTLIPRPILGGLLIYLGLSLFSVVQNFSRYKWAHLAVGGELKKGDR